MTIILNSVPEWFNDEMEVFVEKKNMTVRYFDSKKKIKIPNKVFNNRKLFIEYLKHKVIDKYNHKYFLRNRKNGVLTMFEVIGNKIKFNEYNLKGEVYPLERYLQ